MKFNTFSKFALFCLFALLVSNTIVGQTPDQIQQITQNYDFELLDNLKKSYQDEFAMNQKDLEARAKQLGIKMRFTDRFNKSGDLQYITPEGIPIYYTTSSNVAAGRSTRANHLNIGGDLGLDLEGNNLTVGVWDGGHGNVNHVEYVQDGDNTINRYRVMDAPLNIANNHAAHVAGTIMASGIRPDARGMATQSEVEAYTWTNDIAEITTAASNGLLISNHSYGWRVTDDNGNPSLPAYFFGAYLSSSRQWDAVQFNAPFYLTVVAAGNEGNANNINTAPLNGNANFDKLLNHGTAKNTLVVANALDASVADNGDLNSAVIINTGSSEGPTDDLRIKPDITGNGTGLVSTGSQTNNQYLNYTGTSMASPNVAGTLLLLQEHHNRVNGNFMRAATLKGLALHTADDAGIDGPDAIFGWGLLNARDAAEAITNETDGGSIISELNLDNNQTQSFTVTASGNENLMASISWTDRPGTANNTLNSADPALVNDLDVRITQGNTTEFPFRLTGVETNERQDNTVDPYERIDIQNPSGVYTITVNHKGTLVGNSQAYSLIVTGITNASQDLDNIALNKATSQSSDYTPIPNNSDRAVDGNTSGVWGNSSLSCTNNEQGWWRVDLGNVYDVSEIKIYNRTDCCSQRIANTTVYAGTADSTDPDDYTSVGDLVNLAVNTLENVSTQARYIMIRRNNSDYLTLAEVEVFGTLAISNDNIALQKPTQQSNTAHGGVSDRAVDGNNSGVWSENSVTHTPLEQGWWRVDLGDVYDLSEIKVYNRTDCCAARISGTTVYAGNSESSSPADFTAIGDLVNLPLNTFSNLNTQARYILIKRSNSNYLSLAEVEVYGTLAMPHQNIALEKPTEQSNVAYGGVPQRAVDGNTSGIWGQGSVTHTPTEQGWWRVDLQGLHDISEIKIYNRTDCCTSRITGSTVYAGTINSTNPNDFISIGNLEDIAVNTFSNLNMQARYILISRNNVEALSLAEVEVFGILSNSGVSQDIGIYSTNTEVKSLILFPNPVVNGQLSFKVQSAAPAYVRIVSMATGNQVYSNRHVGNTVDVSNLTAGTYVAMVTLETGQTISERFIIVR